MVVSEVSIIFIIIYRNFRYQVSYPKLLILGGSVLHRVKSYSPMMDYKWKTAVLDDQNVVRMDLMNNS